MQEYFLKLFRYNEWANNQVIKAMEQSSNLDPQAVKLLAHLIASQNIWLARILKSDTTNIEMWPNDTLDDCKGKIQQSSEEWTEFIETMNDEHFKEDHLYKNSKGDLFKSSMEEILTHVANHGSYHRAQINQLLRQNGNEPAVTDYIFYTREKRD